MAAINPKYIKQPGGGGGLDSHTLTDAEYAAFLLLLPYAGQEPVLETDGKVVTDNSGHIVYASNV